VQRQALPNSASPRKTPPWRVAGLPLAVRLAQVAAVLLVGLLIGVLALTFSLRNQVRTGIGSNTPLCATDTAASSRPVKSSVELTEGLRLHMVTERVGWAIGASANNNNWATLLRTTDGGYHWKQVIPKQLASQGIDDLYILDETTAWLPGKDSWYRTTDGGATWQPLGGLRGPIQSFSFSDQNHGWMIPLSFSGETHYKTPLATTSDGGNTWRQTSTIPFSSIREYHAITEHTGWAITQESSAKDALYSKVALYVTHDTGCTWEQRQLPTPPGIANKAPSFAFGPTFFTEKDGALFAAFGQDATHDMYLYVTHDGGTSWQVQGNAIPGYVGVRSVVDDHHIIVDSGSVGADLQMDLLALSNGQWQQQTTPPVKGGSAEVSFPSASTGLALVRTLSNDFELYRTTNGGKIWQQIATLPSAS
jgi:photosystem II stability/assembly factor-like uncharacterized protein